MGFLSCNVSFRVMLYFFSVLAFQFCCIDGYSTLVVNGAAANASAIRIPKTFLGAFLEEINHAVEGGLWAELVSNRGFEAGRPNNTLNPWLIIGNESSISASINNTSCFQRNKAALQIEVHCGASNPCPSGGVGISNPGYWGMNIEQGKRYKVVYHVKSEGAFDFQLSFTGVDVIKVAFNVTNVSEDEKWKRVETILEANATNHFSSLQITTTINGSYLLDQVSAMPLDTYMGHGFRQDLFQMVADLKPKFLRFPGGTYVEGEYLANRFQWKDTIGPWEERPGHMNDVWKYWSDDAIGYLDYLQLAEDLGALPIWVFNAGISKYHEEINASDLAPYVQEALDGIEFARGSPQSQWGSVRAAMGHPRPFNLTYVAIGNEDCDHVHYQGNYLVFHDAIRYAYPDIKIISNCDASSKPLSHPADLFDYHIYTNSEDMFSHYTLFDKTIRPGPKAFVSEYAVWREDAANGSLLAAVAEAAFLTGLEKNSDIVEMACYAPLFTNINDMRWIPDAIVFNSYQLYATPSYWVQKLFIESSGAIFVDSTLNTNSSNKLTASAIVWQNSTDMKNYLRIKVVNFGTTMESLNISINGLNVQQEGSTLTVLTSTNVMDENSLVEPKKVVPQTSPLEKAGKDMNVILPPYSVTSLDLLT